MDINEYQNRVMQLGRHTRCLLEMHLEDPQQMHPTKIVETLFAKFEEFELEGALENVK